MIKLLKSLNLEQYKEIFEDEGIDDIEILKKYNVEELKSLGVKGGHIKKLLAIETNIISIDDVEREKRRKTKKIFISYGHDKHVKLIQSIRDDLLKHGFEVWMDDENLQTKDFWSHEIERAIENADEIVYFITPYSARRPDSYCLKELRYALDSSKGIIPIMLDYYKVPIDINLLQWMDLQPLAKEYNEAIYRKFIDDLVEVVHGNKQYNTDEKQINLKKLLKPLDFTYDIKKHIKNFIGREWLYENVNKLLFNNDANLLWITAEAGFGKTAFSTLLMTKHPNAVGIFFCDYKSENRKNAKNLLTTLIYQLSTQLVEYKQLLEDSHTDQLEHIYMMSSVDMLKDLLIQPLSRLKVSEKYFFIIDALEEAEINGKNELVNIVQNLSALPSWLNIVITSRPEPYLKQKLSKLRLIQTNTQLSENIEDLKEYIKQSSDKKNCKFLKEDKNASILLSKSEGNMLYIKKVVEAIILGQLTHNNFYQLPPGMDGFYFNMFERYFSDISEYKKWQRPLFELMVRANEALSLKLIMEILNWNEYDINDALYTIGSIIEKNNNNIDFYHKSIVDWLTNQDKSGIFYISTEKGTEQFDKKINNMNLENAAHFLFEYLEVVSYLSTTKSDYWSKRVLYFMNDPEVGNSEFIKTLVLDLKQLGFIISIDRHKLTVGDDWERKLEFNLSIANKVLLFMTSSSVRRPDGYCLNELSFALYKQKEIIPIMLEPVIPPLSISRLNYLDFKDMRINNGYYKEKLSELISVLENEKNS